MNAVEAILRAPDRITDCRNRTVLNISEAQCLHIQENDKAYVSVWCKECHHRQEPRKTPQNTYRIGIVQQSKYRGRRSQENWNAFARELGHENERAMWEALIEEGLTYEAMARYIGKQYPGTVYNRISKFGLRSNHRPGVKPGTKRYRVKE